MDASQYKDYVLVLLFIKYISDKYAGMPYASITVPEGSSFKDMVALKGKPTIGDDINKKIIGKIAEANKLTGTIDVADFNNADKLGSGKEMVDRLTRLIAIFENPELDFSKNRAEGDDILGDAYEYLMRHFATESGKSKGQFYTPAEVSRVMAKIIGVNACAAPSTMIYDPTCGSGSLLLKVADETEKGITIYGQENDTATAALARMNMILHNNPTAEIKQGNTLSNPLFLDATGRLKTFDFVVANPPFSFKSWSNGVDAVNDVYGRFKDYGIPPAKNGDYAFLLHIIRSLKSKGKGAVILPHGVLFRGNTEAEIRTNIIRRGYIKGIIGLPPNLFYGTGIPACIIVLDKENADNRKGIFMIDASKGFEKDGNKNRLREQDIHSGRTYDERHLTKFINEHRLPVNPTTAFLTPTLRNIDHALTTDRELVGRPRDLYKKTLELLEDVAEQRIAADVLFVEAMRVLLLLRDEKLSRIASLLGALERTEGALPLSSEAIVTLISQHLACKNASRLPVLVVAAAYEAAGTRLAESMLPLNSHNAADLQTGSLGDVEICLVGDDSVVTAYEMKMKRVTQDDIDAAVTKIARASKRIHNYMFVTTDAIDPIVAEYAATFYEKTDGTEIAILDCVDFLRHFLHLFHRIRSEYLNAYQALVLDEPDSAVSQTLKEAFLALRQAAESGE